MRIVTVRRISQVFFFAMFVWFCIVSTVGERFWQLRGWPIDWFFQLDPLVAIGTVLTTHTLYWPLLWALLTIILTIIFGRFFCGWVCPFGSLHHFVGFWARHGKNTSQKIQLNKYRRVQHIKYYVLIVFLAMAAFPSAASTLQTGLLDPIAVITRSFNLLLLPIADSSANLISVPRRFYEGAWLVFAIFVAAVLLNLVIPRFYCRFVCPLGALFGVIDRFAIWRIGKNPNECIDCKLCERNCEGGCEPGGNIRISECILCFNCREDCKNEVISYQTRPSFAGEITNPDVSRRGFVLSLAGGILAVPAVRLSNKLGTNWYHKVIRPPGALPEEEFLKRCVKCSQCMRVCPTNVIQPGGIEGGLENLWTPTLNYRIGSSGCQLNCVACGQVCPTSAIRPITLAEKLGGQEFLFDIELKFESELDKRIISQALRREFRNNDVPLSTNAQISSEHGGEQWLITDSNQTYRVTKDQDELKVYHDFTRVGPVKLGTAFVDRNRCLPWAMDKPCIVCQENCPVSPKAIYTRECFNTVRDGTLTVTKVTDNIIEVKEILVPDRFATGDYYCTVRADERRKIVANTENSLEISSDRLSKRIAAAGERIEVEVRLQQPYIDIDKCIGCGVCEHECPVSGKKAIRVSAVGETRSADRRLLLKSG
jgi:polyferredoxin/formate hydrogenlyase subunit 6/NADH:ubiquinone oxidoreductase subunit I